MKYLGWLTALTALATVAAVLGLSASPAVAAPGSCSVSSTNEGIALALQEDPAAESYVYRLEVEGQSNMYDRAYRTGWFIELPVGATGTVFLSSVFSDGSYSAAIACGSAQPNAGTGAHTQTCAVESVNNGVSLTWSEVPGAAEYVYSLYTEQRGQLYDRIPTIAGSQFVGLNEGEVGNFRISGVYADGSYSNGADCGEAGPLPGSGSYSPTCFSETVQDGPDRVVTASWELIPEAVTHVYRVDLLTFTDNRDFVDERFYERTDARTSNPLYFNSSDDVLVTITVSGVRADGSYTPGINCGSQFLDPVS